MEIVSPRYVVDEHQKPTDVVLTMEEWQRVLAELEELDDIRAYDEAKAAPQEAAAGRREDFERYLAAVPEAPVPDTDRVD